MCAVSRLVRGSSGFWLACMYIHPLAKMLECVVQYYDGTNHLFGLSTAAMVYEFPAEFDTVNFKVMDVMYPEHADLCEVLGRLINGSYGQDEEIGLNPTLAGGGTLRGAMAINRKEFDPLWEGMRQDANDSDVFDKVKFERSLCVFREKRNLEEMKG